MHATQKRIVTQVALTTDMVNPDDWAKKQNKLVMGSIKKLWFKFQILLQLFIHKRSR